MDVEESLKKAIEKFESFQVFWILREKMKEGFSIFCDVIFTWSKNRNWLRKERDCCCEVEESWGFSEGEGAEGEREAFRFWFCRNRIPK